MNIHKQGRYSVHQNLVMREDEAGFWLHWHMNAIRVVPELVHLFPHCLLRGLDDSRDERRAKPGTRGKLAFLVDGIVSRSFTNASAGVHSGSDALTSQQGQSRFGKLDVLLR